MVNTHIFARKFLEVTMSIDIDAAVKEFKAVLKDHSRACNNIEDSVAGILNKNGSVYVHRSYGCYGWTYSYGDKESTEAVMTYLKGKKICKLSDNMQLEWISYITEHSPYANTIVNDAEHIFNTRVVIGDITKPMNVMYGAIFSLRMMYERQALVKMWHDFVHIGGLTRNEAFFMIATMHPAFDRTTDFTEDFDVWINTWNSSDHMPLFMNYMNSDSIKNMINGKVMYTIPPMKVHTNMYGVQRMFNKKDGIYSDGDKTFASLQKDLAAVNDIINKNQVKVKVNPFMVKKADGDPNRPKLKWSKIVQHMQYIVEILRKHYA